jgi:hypothetical protein
MLSTAVNVICVILVILIAWFVISIVRGARKR